ncbi:MAG TPA: hypothetical protein VFS43_02315 [Polyangiaceae bacterium]|nr:hypothetical protein [Polyangiaceae bacterium]
MATPPEPRSAASVIEHLFTNPNPTSGSGPPEHMAWVVFENGTAFFTTPSDALPLGSSLDALERAAKAALDELGPVRAGGPAGDFNVSHLATWFPGEFVFFVSFDHNSIATVVTGDSDDRLSAGLEGRSRRDVDVREKKVVVARGFDGAKTPGAG